MENKIESLESENDQGKMELEKAKSVQEELKVINEDRNELKKKVAILESELDVAKVANAEQKVSDSSPNDLEKKVELLQEELNHAKSVQDELNVAIENRNELEKKVSILESELDLAKTAHNEQKVSDTTTNDLEKKVEFLQEELNQAKNDANDRNELEKKVAILESELDLAKNAHAEVSDSKTNDLEKKVELLEVELTQANNVKDELNAVIDNRNELEKKVAMLESKLKVEDSHVEANQEISALQAKLKSLQLEKVQSEKQHFDIIDKLKQTQIENKNLLAEKEEHLELVEFVQIEKEAFAKDLESLKVNIFFQFSAIVLDSYFFLRKHSMLRGI